MSAANKTAIQSKSKYDIRVTNREGETVAMFRGKSAQIKGSVIPAHH